jgi:zinc/manganese transport system substrate-binding protein
MRRKTISSIALAMLFFVIQTSSAQIIEVVTTLPTYAALAKEIGGNLVNTRAIARGDEDAHFVRPRPSFAAMVGGADLFITTGLDLELWVPALLERANNQRVLPGAPGHVTAYPGVLLRDIPATATRTDGDVHLFGNPHLHTDPANATVVARNIAEGLKRVDPGNAATYERNLSIFSERLANRLFGEQLTEALGASTLLDLAVKGEFWTFVEGQSLGGRPLTTYLGGWLAAGEKFRNRTIVCYHKNWAYFAARFKVNCGIFVEPQPGIPPSPGHVRQVIDFIDSNNIPAIFAANYYSRSQVERVASRTGAESVIVPLETYGEEGIEDYFSLVDSWVNRLAAVMR